MEIGKEEPAIWVEPIEDPFQRDEPVPKEEPIEVPERVPDRDREKVPA